MNPFSQSLLSLAGRLLLALLFIPAGISKITGFEGTVGFIASKGLPAAGLMAAGAIAVELGAGLALAAGWHARLAALLLAGFTLVASVIFHNFWAMPADQQMLQSLMFMKNIGVVGGLLMVVAAGAGAWSLDARRNQH